jgi:hypothetical protein
MNTHHGDFVSVLFRFKKRHMTETYTRVPLLSCSIKIPRLLQKLPQTDSDSNFLIKPTTA